MIIQIGTEIDESRILWKHKETDEWTRADIDDLIRAYESMHDMDRDLYDIMESIEKLSSAEPKTGEWMLLEYEYLTCSECGDDHWTGCESTAEARERLKSGDYPNYCSNCGAKMNSSFYGGHTSRV